MKRSPSKELLQYWFTEIGKGGVSRDSQALMLGMLMGLRFRIDELLTRLGEPPEVEAIPADGDDYCE